jgi:hypothetical protein
MPSYVDELTEDRGRVLKALTSLIEEQEELVRDLTDALTEYREVLDRAILRTMIYRNVFGATQTQSIMAEKDAQDASRPVTETTAQVERESEVLRVYREALKQIDTGLPLSMALGRLPMGT